MAYGIAHGSLGVAFNLKFDIKVTPKGPGGVKPLPFSLLAPMLLLSGAGGASLLASSSASGNAMTAVYAFTYWLAGFFVTVLHWSENGFGPTTRWQRVRILAPSCVALFIVGVLIVLGSVRVSPERLLW